MSVRMLVVGSANMDFVMNCERLPCAGETMLSYEPYEYAGGGKGANTAGRCSTAGSAGHAGVRGSVTISTENACANCTAIVG